LWAALLSAAAVSRAANSVATFKPARSSGASRARPRGPALPIISDDATRNRWSADAAARAGIAVDRTLVYGKAGLAAGRFEFSFSHTDPTEGQNGSATLAGLLVGGGVEYAVAPNWSLKLEYDHIDYFGRDVGFDTPFVGHILEHDAAAIDVLAFGINYRFGDVPFAPAADRAGTRDLQSTGLQGAGRGKLLDWLLCRSR
jgi:opacity protein-like surface antigen